MVGTAEPIAYPPADVITDFDLPDHQDEDIDDGCIPDEPIEADPGQWQGGTHGGFVTCIGWDGDKDSVICEPGGTVIIRDTRNIKLSFGIFNEFAGPYGWKLEEGHFPNLGTIFQNGDWNVAIAVTCDRVVISSAPYTIIYARVRIRNDSGSPATPPLPEPSRSWVLLDGPDPIGSLNSGQSNVYEYAVAADRFGMSSQWPSDEDIRNNGGWKKHHGRMKAFWTAKLSEYARIFTPESAINDAIMSSIITTHIIKTGTSLNVGSNGYKRVYDHDAVGSTVSLMQFGCLGAEARDFLHVLPTGFQFDDATWKYAWPHAVFIHKTGDLSIARSCWSTLRQSAHKIASDRTGPNGIMKLTNDIDSQGYWTVDCWSAMTGLLAYAYVCRRLNESSEERWAMSEYGELHRATDEAVKRLGTGYIPASLTTDNNENRCSNPNDANWAAPFFFGRWGVDGWMLGANDGDLGSIDVTYSYGLGRLRQATEDNGGRGTVSFGGYPPCFHSTSYNAAYASAGLRHRQHRTLVVQAWRFMIRHAQGGPNAWWESMVAPEFNPFNNASRTGDKPQQWLGIHPAWGQGSCPHIWGQMSSSKALLDALVTEFFDDRVMVGRGVPSSWLLATMESERVCSACGNERNWTLAADIDRIGHAISIWNVPIASKRVDVDIWLGDCPVNLDGDSVSWISASDVSVPARGSIAAVHVMSDKRHAPTCWFRLALTAGCTGVLPALMLTLPCMMDNIAGIVIGTEQTLPLSILASVVADGSDGSVYAPGGMCEGVMTLLIGVVLKKCIH